MIKRPSWIKFPKKWIQPLPRWTLFTAGGFLGGAFLLWCLLILLPNKNVPDIVSEADKRRADLVNSNRENVLKVIQTFAGLGFFGTAYLAWRNYHLTEDKNVSERFKDGIQMLGDDKMAVRLGGIFLLERISRDSLEDHPVVMEVLTAFIREKTTSQEYGTPVKPKADIQAALIVIGRRDIRNESPNYRITFAKAKLYGADLLGAKLNKSVFSQTDLRYAFLREAKLNYSIFLAADLRGAYLGKSDLSSANFSKTNFSEADFSEVNLKDIKWDDETNWTDVKGLDTAQNVPEALKQQLGLTPLPAKSQDPTPTSNAEK